MKAFVLLMIVTAVAGLTITQDQQKNSLRNDQKMSSSSSSESVEELKIDEPMIELKAITMEEYLENPGKYVDQLNDNGLWVNWNVTTTNIPGSSVYAGYDKESTFYVMRADHQESNGHYVGKLIGRFDPSRQHAWVGYNGIEANKTHFDLLLHQRSRWASKSEPGDLVPGTKLGYICRAQYEYVEYYIPGRITSDRRFCKITHNGQELSLGGYESLRKVSCDKMVLTSKPYSSKPVIVEHKQLKMNPQLYASSLDQNGVWLYWNIHKIGVPPNAVFGGHTKNGPGFLIMADHQTSKGVYVGRIPGVYYPKIRTAYIQYEGQIEEKSIFEILVHNSYLWTSERNSTQLVRVKYEDQAEYGFCNRALGDDLHAGVLDFEKMNCTITYFDKVESYLDGYMDLRRSCP